MTNIAAIWQGLNVKQRIGLGLTVGLMFVVVLGVGRMASAPQMALLYSGLDASAAGEVIAAVDARAVPYEVRGNAIYVDRRERDRLRMMLASDGLPAMGAKGYELLDQLSGFGTTSQMFDAAYWRAKEGELARTIIAAPHIRSARVHISGATANPFDRHTEISAAVSVTTASGALNRAQIRALRHLVAAAVSDLHVRDVAIIDDDTGLVASGDEDSVSAGEDPLVDAMKARVERLIAARVGPGNAVVELDIEKVSERETIVERRFDPESRVAISADVEERSESQQGENPGSVTVASNLPDGDANGAAGAGTSSTSSQTRERTNFEVSETQRELERAPGDIRKITVAVLLNDVAQVAEDGTVTREPRSAEEIQVLRALVASAVGFSEARGDVISIESLAFEQVTVAGVAGSPSSLREQLDVMQIIQLAVGAIVVLILALFVFRPLLAQRTATSARAAEPPAELPSLDMPAADTGAAALPDLSEGFPAMAEPLDFGGFDTASPLEGDTPVDRLRGMIADRQEETLQVLQSWIDGEVLDPQTEETSA